MAADRVLAVDAGTSAIRAVLVSADGQTELVDAQPYHAFVPEDAAPFGREFVPRDLAGALGRLVDNAVAVSAGGIAAVAFTGQREGIAFLDDARAALFASPNVDARASAEGIAIDAVRGAKVYRMTGHLPSLMQAPAKLAWLRAHRPEAAARVATVLPLVDWLGSLLGGTPRISRALAGENGLLDVAGGGVPASLLAESGFDSALVPPIVSDGDVVGDVAVGPLTGRPLVLAGADTQCALLGMGVVAVGEGGVSAGWSAPVQLVTAAPVFDPAMRTWTGVHVAPQRWILESNAGEAGRAWDWISNLLSVTPEAAGRIAADAPAGSRDVTTVIGALAMRASEMTAGVGAITFPLPLVMSSAGLADVLRSMLEACAFAIRCNLEQLEEVAALQVQGLRFGGGMSRIGLLPQMLADVIDRPVPLARSPETSAVGAAMLAFVAIGRFRSLDEAARAMTGGQLTFEPRPRQSAEYDDYYARWRELSARMMEAN